MPPSAASAKREGEINVLINNAANSVDTRGAIERFAGDAVYTEAYDRIALNRRRRSATIYITSARLPLRAESPKSDGDGDLGGRPGRGVEEVAFAG